MAKLQFRDTKGNEIMHIETDYIPQMGQSVSFNEKEVYSVVNVISLFQRNKDITHRIILELKGKEDQAVYI